MTPIQPTRTKYGQLACGLCKLDPPLGDSGICYRCAQGQTPVSVTERPAFEWDDDDVPKMGTDVPTVGTPAPAQVAPAKVTATNEAEPQGDEVTPAAGKLSRRRSANTGGFKSDREHRRKNDTPHTVIGGGGNEDLKTMTRAELEAILAAPVVGRGKDEVENRRRRLARSRLWHMKQKGQ